MEPRSLRELAALFLKLGAVGFGGPAAHIALMEEEVVRKRKWLSHEEFLDLLGATQLIPGPNSTEMAIHVGRTQAGWPGLLVSGISFILPAFLIVTLLAVFYVAYGTVPELRGILYGIQPVMIAVILQAIWNLGKTALRSRRLVVLAVVAAVLHAAGVHELALLFGAGAAMAMVDRIDRRSRRHELKSLMLLAGLGLAQSGAVERSAPSMAFGLRPLFFFFLKVGSVLFGSGYLLIAFLQADLVARRGWLTQGQLLDAVAIGQVTPGPVLTTATFIGYLLGGAAGAIVATVGIFLPSFFFVALSGPLLPRLRRSPAAGAALNGMNAVAAVLMGAVALQLAGTSFVDAPTVLLGAVSAMLLIGGRVGSFWLIVIGGILGFTFY